MMAVATRDQTEQRQRMKKTEQILSKALMLFSRRLADAR